MGATATAIKRGTKQAHMERNEAGSELTRLKPEEMIYFAFIAFVIICISEIKNIFEIDLDRGHLLLSIERYRHRTTSAFVESLIKPICCPCKFDVS